MIVDDGLATGSCMRAAVEALGRRQPAWLPGESATPRIRTLAAGADCLDHPTNDAGQAAQNLHENLPGTRARWCGPPRRGHEEHRMQLTPEPARRAHADPGRLPVLTVCHVIRAMTVDT
jgi:hypothetical protein